MRLNLIHRWRLLIVLMLVIVLAAAGVQQLNARGVQHWGGIVPNSIEDGHSHTHVHEPAEASPQLSTVQTSELLDGAPCDETTGTAGPYPCKNVDLLSYVPTNELSGGGTGADIWGWTDPATGREYVVQGHSEAISFVDITEPSNPVFVGTLPAPVPNALWRDVKVYDNHAYVVGDGDFVLPHGLQIFDLTQLRDPGLTPAVFEQTAHYDEFGNAHNIAINEETGVGYVVGSDTCNGGLHMISLDHPTEPQFLGCFAEDGYTHDAQCTIYHGPDVAYQGNEICFNSNTDTLTIADVTDPESPSLLARESYDGVGYTHQGWLTADHRYFVLGDELDEMNNGHNTRTYLWDVSDLDNPVHFSTYVGPTPAIDHNLYIRDGFVFETNYTAGLRILDASDIANGALTEVAYFDTHPTNNAAAFAGGWSSYVFFESGVVALSNIEDGLYVLKPNLDDDDPTPTPTGGGAATGGGWLETDEGKKVNVNFNVEETSDGPGGKLKLRDQTAGIRVHITKVTAIGDVTGACGSIMPGDNALEFHGEGTSNGSAHATFRVCVEDNGTPGKDEDKFYLACMTGCGYNTAERTPNDIVDGGNMQVQQSSGSDSDTSASQATTLHLDPLLMSEGDAGALQTFSVTVYDQNRQPMENADVTLTRTAADDAVETLSGTTDVTGIATFTTTILDQPAEYVATAGHAESNTIIVTPLLK